MLRPKPLRSHHCRHCRRCIPKMDHHCPWTGTCVSLQTFPYFLRFLLYTNITLWYFARLLWQRIAAVWAARHLPSYLGPSLGSLVGLTLLALANAGTMLALGVLLYTTVKGWVFNSTMIEDWEGTGWEWEENGFNDLPGLWPPPDPEKMRQAKKGGWPGAGLRQQGQYDEYQSPEDVKAAFARRQEEDFSRRQRAHAQQRSGIIAELEETDEFNEDVGQGEGYEWVGKPLWANSDGDRLWDYGVDEEVEEEIIPAWGADEDVPLAELIRRRKVSHKEDEG
ncbi:Palmitoyltransferase [Collariella sp. IMI 366227]|nr:Palmitoyltransferase [Collariella sp. IMI 366227]